MKADSAGITVSYNGNAWIGAALHFTGYEPDRIYRLTLERTVEGEPAAVIVRNRQMDLERKQIPIGSGTFAVEFVSPSGSHDKVDVAFIPDNPGKPQGTLRITSVKIERLGE